MSEIKLGDWITFPARVPWWRRALIALGLAKQPPPRRMKVAAVTTSEMVVDGWLRPGVAARVYTAHRWVTEGETP